MSLRYDMSRLVSEPWITPSLFRKAPTSNISSVVDEWTLCAMLVAADCLDLFRKHWATFITETDFQQIQAFNLNSVRIPIGWWALTALRNKEPYVQGQLGYLGKALEWSIKYQLDVFVDLHGAVGSQNGFDNSGHKGDIDFGSSATYFYQTIAALTNLTAFVLQPQYKGVVKAIELLNEPFPFTTALSIDDIQRFYGQANAAVQSVLYSANNVDSQYPAIVFHDAFSANWSNFFTLQKIVNPILDTVRDFFMCCDTSVETFEQSMSILSPNGMLNTTISAIQTSLMPRVRLKAMKRTLLLSQVNFRWQHRFHVIHGQIVTRIHLQL